MTAWVSGLPPFSSRRPLPLLCASQRCKFTAVRLFLYRGQAERMLRGMEGDLYHLLLALLLGTYHIPARLLRLILLSPAHRHTLHSILSL